MGTWAEGFNWNLYKDAVDEPINSQDREQMHSLLEKCSESMRLMSYENFMIFMKGEFIMYLLVISFTIFFLLLGDP